MRVCGAPARIDAELALRRSLRERFLTSQVMTLPEYLDRLSRQARGESVFSMRTVPVVHRYGESATEEVLVFSTWAHRVCRLQSIEALIASFTVEDVHLERTLRYDFAKLKAKGCLKPYYCNRYAALTVPLHTSAQTDSDPSGLDPTQVNDPFAATPTDGKRSGSQDAGTAP